MTIQHDRVLSTEYSVSRRDFEQLVLNVHALGKALDRLAASQEQMINLLITLETKQASRTEE